MVPAVAATYPIEDFQELPESTIEQLVNSIERTGYGVVPNYLHAAEVAELRRFVERAVAAGGNEYVQFTGTGDLTGTVLERMAQSPAFRRLCTQIYERATGQPAPSDDYYFVLRCLSGKSGEQHSLRFHYDSYVLTVLLPIHIPQGRRSGDLLMIPNSRRLRSHYALNLVDKVLLDNPLTQWLLRRLAARRSSRLLRLRMTPGNLYLFWGCRSIHTNEPCDNDQIRATALFHYVDPHRDSRLKRLLR